MKKYDQYEFLLEYPPFEGFNHWKQTNFPLDERINKIPEGYLNISNTWIDKAFGGLIYNGHCSLLKGSVNSLWYFAIGTIYNCNNYGVYHMPGPEDNFFKTVQLWMKVPLVKVLYKGSSCKKSYNIFMFTAYAMISK